MNENDAFIFKKSIIEYAFYANHTYRFIGQQIIIIIF